MTSAAQVSHWWQSSSWSGTSLRSSPPPTGGKNVSSMKQVNEPLDLPASLHPFGCAGGSPIWVRILHPLGCASCSPGDDSGAVLAADAEHPQGFIGADPGHLKHAQVLSHRGNVGQREYDQIGMPNRLPPRTSGHARADELSQIGPGGLSIVLAAERLPADMLTRCVVLQRPQRTAAGNRTLRTPLPVPLPPSAESRRPVIRSAILGIGEAETASHAGNVLTASGVPAGSDGILKSAPDEGVGGPASCLEVGRRSRCLVWKGRGLGVCALAGWVVLVPVVVSTDLPDALAGEADLAHDVDLPPAFVGGLPDSSEETGVGRAFALLCLLVRPRQHAQIRCVDHA